MGRGHVLSIYRKPLVGQLLIAETWVVNSIQLPVNSWWTQEAGNAWIQQKDIPKANKLKISPGWEFDVPGYLFALPGHSIYPYDMGNALGAWYDKGKPNHAHIHTPLWVHCVRVHLWMRLSTKIWMLASGTTHEHSLCIWKIGYFENTYIPGTGDNCNISQAPLACVLSLAANDSLRGHGPGFTVLVGLLLKPCFNNFLIAFICLEFMWRGGLTTGASWALCVNLHRQWNDTKLRVDRAKTYFRDSNILAQIC